jgi:hypothetical protein
MYYENGNKFDHTAPFKWMYVGLRILYGLTEACSCDETLYYDVIQCGMDGGKFCYFSLWMPAVLLCIMNKFKMYFCCVLQVEEVIAKYKSALQEKRYRFNMGTLMGKGLSTRRNTDIIWECRWIRGFRQE